MNFFKKNWGFLTFSVLGIIVIGFAVFMWIGALKAKKAEEAKVTQAGAFFTEVENAKRHLDPENITKAKQNEKFAEEEFRRLLQMMVNRSAIKYAQPVPLAELQEQPMTALKLLQEEIAKMQKQLDDAMIDVNDATCEYFTFDDIAGSMEPPHRDDLAELFRQLEIIKDLVRLCIGSGIMTIEDMERPMGLASMSEDLYTYTPVNITITGSPNAIQRFLNNINNDDRLLFFIRNMELDGEENYTDIGSDLSGIVDGLAGVPGAGFDGDGTGGGAAGMGGMRGGMMDGLGGGRRSGGGGMMGGMRRSRRGGMDDPVMGGMGGMGGAKDNQEQTGPYNRLLAQLGMGNQNNMGMGGGVGMAGMGPMGMQTGRMAARRQPAQKEGEEPLGLAAQMAQLFPAVKRQALLIFGAKTMTLQLRVDCVEFLPPEEPPADEDAEAADDSAEGNEAEGKEAEGKED